MREGRAWDATTVTALGDGRYTATVTEHWMLLVVPQGGVLAAIAARAMEAELGTGQELRSIHGVFASPVPEGPVEITVEVLRRGRSMSQAQATVRAPGAKAGFTALAAFGHVRTGFTFTELTMPEVPLPDDCPSYRDPPPPESGFGDGPQFPFWRDVLEGRPALGSPPWDRPAGLPAEVATWFRFEDAPLDESGGFDQLALLVAADMMPSAVFERLGGFEERMFAPSVDLTVHLETVPRGEWILNHNKAHFAADGYASAEATLWDPVGEHGPTLLAWATQLMFFTPFD